MRLLCRLLAAAALLLPAAAHAEPLTVFAAASLTDALQEIAAGYARLSPDKIIFNFGASSTLARQIELGAPADIFFSADEAKMDNLQSKGLIDPSTRKARLGNALVIVVPKDSTLTISSAQALAGPDVKRVALADPKAVPAGVYAKAYLQKIHLWQAIEPKVVAAENVRAALAAVASGNIEAGIVYKTDAAISKQVRLAFEVPLADGPEISYPKALVKDSGHADIARRFLDYLDSDEAGKIFRKYGFMVRD